MYVLVVVFERKPESCINLSVPGLKVLPHQLVLTPSE